MLTNIGTFKIPTYALNYLVNGDESGLTEEDLRAIDSWTGLYSVHFTGLTFCCSMEDNSYFCNSPEFGLPCKVEEVEVMGTRKLKVVQNGN